MPTAKMPESTSKNEEDELKNAFLELHRGQFKASGLPERYWDTLFQKLKEDVREKKRNNNKKMMMNHKM